jgi:predicted enzyme related to lactoylglutathione lyase
MAEAPEAWIATFSDPDDNYFQLVSPMEWTPESL